MRRMLPLAVCAPLWTASLAAQAAAPARVLPFYVVPKGDTVPRAEVAYTVKVLADVRRWYADATGGHTVAFVPLVIQESRSTFPQLAADSFQAWWPLLQDEFAADGLPWNRHSDFKLLLLTHRAGAWAGSDSENGGLDSAADAGKVDKGAWGGIAIIGDSSVGGVLAGVCPDTAHGKADSTVATAWWCSGSTYRGTVAHELGHTFGLPHPDAFVKGFRCADSTAYTIMQCHWWWEKRALLPYERVHLASLPFFRYDTTPPFDELAERPPVEARGWSAVRFERGSPVAWVDGWGSGTGYLWAVRLAGPAAEATYAVRGSLFTCDAGLPRGAPGGAALEISLDGRPLAEYELDPGAPPARIALPVAGGRRLRVALRGTGAVVLGNPLVWR